MQWKNGRWLKNYSKGAISASYTYDSNGIRVTKSVSDSSKYTGEYREYTTVDGRISSEYVSGGGMSITSYDYRVYYRYEESGSPIGFDLYNNGTTSTYTYAKNIQGDVVGIIDDSTGAQVVAYTYDAWGKITSITGSAASTVGKYNSLRYRGYYYDSETGYYYLQSRYYDPSYKRFINADNPTLIRNQATKSVVNSNYYLYCCNNPVNKIDPNGEDAILLMDKNGAYSFGHIALVLEINDVWFYCSISGGDLLAFTIIKSRVDFGVIYTDFDAKTTVAAINKEIEGIDFRHSIYGSTDLPLYYNSPYTNKLFFEGDYSEGVEYFLDNYYNNTNYKYNVLFDNCSEIAFKILSLGYNSTHWPQYKIAFAKASKQPIPKLAYTAIRQFIMFIDDYLTYSKASRKAVRGTMIDPWLYL